jgi:glycosyltransferase involved in cell wall biosynthesis
MQRIMVIAPTAYVLGGVAVWLETILNGFKEHGLNVTFGALNGEFHQADNYLASYPFPKTIKITAKTGTRYQRVQSIRKAILTVDADIVLVVNAPDVYEAAALIKQQRKPDLKVAMTLHGLQSDFISDVQRYHDILDYVVVTNRLTQNIVQHQGGFPGDRVLYAPYGVDIVQRVATKRDSDTLNLLYVGRIEDEQKRCSDLLKIVTELESEKVNYVLRIAGDGPLKETLVEQLSLVCDIGEIDYLGQLSQEQISTQAYLKSDVLLITSAWETGPIVAWEAIMQGVVVVSSRYTGLKEEGALVNHENCLLFDVGNAAQACECIRQLDDLNLRERLIHNAREMVLQRYTKERSIEHWIDKVEKIAQGKVKRLGKSHNLMSQWPKNGKLETLFGHRYAYFLRKLFHKPAFVNSAGDEWPHSHSNYDSTSIDKIGKKSDNGDS